MWGAPLDRMAVTMVRPSQVEYLDKHLLNDVGYVRVLPAAELHAIEPEHLRAWMNIQAIYQYPTTELVEFLLTRIPATRGTIEICAGRGRLGHALGVRAIDRYTCDEPEAHALYGMMGQPLIRPAVDVERMTAAKAVQKYKPHTVVGAFVTQRCVNSDPAGTGSMFGVREETMLRKVRRYILVGNANTHRHKRIRAKRHRTWRFPWLVSRALRQDLNEIWEWER